MYLKILGRNPSFFTMSPFDEGVTKRVKRAISTINTFSIRLGVFLRRYPVARVFLLCYMVSNNIFFVFISFWIEIPHTIFVKKKILLINMSKYGSILKE